MTYAQIVERLDSVLHYDVTQVLFNPDIKNQFVQMARDIGEPLDRVCGKCIKDKYEFLTKLRYNLSILMAQGKKENKWALNLPKGQTQISAGGVVINSLNFSDEAAESMMKIRPAYKKFFTKVSDIKSNEALTKEVAALKKEIEEKNKEIDSLKKADAGKK